MTQASLTQADLDRLQEEHTRLCAQENAARQARIDKIREVAAELRAQYSTPPSEKGSGEAPSSEIRDECWAAA